MEKLYSGLMSEYALNEEKERRERIEAELEALMQVERQNYKFDDAGFLSQFTEKYDVRVISGTTVKTEEWYRCRAFCRPTISFKTKEECLAHAREDQKHINNWALSRVLQMKGESGCAAEAAYEQKKNWERRDFLVEQQRAVEKMDLSKDPFFTRGQDGSFQCSLCSTIFYNPRDYMFHTLRDRLHSSLAKSVKQSPWAMWLKSLYTWFKSFTISISDMLVLLTKSKMRGSVQREE